MEGEINASWGGAGQGRGGGGVNPNLKINVLVNKKMSVIGA